MAAGYVRVGRMPPRRTEMREPQRTTGSASGRAVPGRAHPGGEGAMPVRWNLRGRSANGPYQAALIGEDDQLHPVAHVQLGDGPR
jgi:hypothetical protein